MRMATGPLVSAVLIVALAGCEYTGPESAPVSSQAQAGGTRMLSFEENVDEVARALMVSSDEPGMPTVGEPLGKLSVDLAPGDYVIKSACAGVHGVTVSIVQGEKPTIGVPYTCDSVLERFVRHAGGPITISTVSPVDKPAAAGVMLELNTDPRASEFEDMSEWVARQLQPKLPGQLAGAASSSSPTSQGLSAEPGSYEVQFLCDGAADVEFSVASWTGAEVLSPMSIPCNGNVFKAPVELRTRGAEFSMVPSSGTKTRYAFKLVPNP